MRKLILAATTIAALAVPTIAPALASASVARYQEQTATFTVLQPKDTVGQFTDVWTHKYDVTINPCDGTFTGTGNVTANNDSSIAWTEKITGSFGDGTVSFATVPNAGATFKVTNAPYDTSVIAESTWTQNIVEMKASAPVNTGSSSFKNHGEYVSSVGGGSDAAHSCIGMPIH